MFEGVVRVLLEDLFEVGEVWPLEVGEGAVSYSSIWLESMSFIEGLYFRGEVTKEAALLNLNLYKKLI